MSVSKNKQEEIREGIARIICPWKLEDLNPGFELKYFDEADQILSYLHSQGVVIKVERGLPEFCYWNTKMPKSAEFYLAELIEAGYVAVELLVKEG